MYNGYQLWNTPNHKKMISGWINQLYKIAQNPIQPSELQIQAVVHELQQTGAIHQDCAQEDLSNISWPYLQSAYQSCLDSYTNWAVESQDLFTQGFDQVFRLLQETKQLVKKDGSVIIPSPFHQDNIKEQIGNTMAIVFVDVRFESKQEFLALSEIQTKAQYNRLVNFVLKEIESYRQEWISVVKKSKQDLFTKWKAYRDLKFEIDAINRERTRHLITDQKNLFKLL